MRRQSIGRKFMQHYQSNLLLKEKLDGIESRLDQISEHLKESGKRNFYFVGIGMGVAGLGMALGLSITSPAWSSTELQPSQFSFLLTGISLVVIYWCFLGLSRGQYKMWITLVGTLFLIIGSVGFTVSNIWLNVTCINLEFIAVLFFLVGLCILPIAILFKGRKKGEVLTK